MPTLGSRTRHDARSVLRIAASGALTLLIFAACASVLEPLPDQHAVIIVLPPTAPADGASLTRIIVQVDTAVPPALRRVMLTTTAGNILGGGAPLTPDATGQAIALLQSPLSPVATIVGATVNGVVGSAEIDFQRALAERILLTYDSLSLKAGVGNQSVITATLTRNVGALSPGAQVAFTATDTAGRRVPTGLFLPVLAQIDSQGKATVRFTVADTSVRGPLLIHATSDTTAATATVWVTAP
jgi:hypothetical protein